MVLGIIFVLIISFMPEGLVPGSVRICRSGYRAMCGRMGVGARGPLGIADEVEPEVQP
jgi:hypothetical protein